MRVPSLMLIGLVALSVPHAAAQSSSNSGAPEVFNVNAQAKGEVGAGAATFQIHIQRYTPDFDRTAVRRVGVFFFGDASSRLYVDQVSY